MTTRIEMLTGRIQPLLTNNLLQTGGSDGKISVLKGT